MANSLGAEDMVLTDVIATSQLPIEIFSLDTGRLPLETYDLMAKVQQHYGLKLKFFYPNHDAIEAFTREHGINAFYDSVELRKACCHARKVEPLGRALAGKRPGSPACAPSNPPPAPTCPSASSTRATACSSTPVRLDREGSLGLHPPQQGSVQRLHDKFYPASAAPPARAGVGEVRAGRWWWENPETKECGLHVKWRAEEPLTRVKPMSTLTKQTLSHLDWLESEAIHIMREVAGQCSNPVLLFSGGKDSICMLRLAEKAFRPGKFPFPLMHIDTGHNYRSLPFATSVPPSWASA
jgi:phosphoadenosine phosphosulfate reductase